MYVTKRLSHLKKFPNELSVPPPEGPNSGILVIQDEEAEPTCCFGMYETERIKQLPLPQNKKLEISFATGFHPNRILHFYDVAFVPVLNHPLSSNLYYPIQPFGKDRGEAFTNSKVEDMRSYCCFFPFDDDELPRALNPENKIQQVQIRRYLTGFVAKSVTPDGRPPKFLRKKGWRLDASTSKNLDLNDALGLDAPLRARLPEFDFPLEHKASKPVIVGKWYTPIMFIKEGTPKTLRDERSTSMFYEVTLEQRWEKIFSCERNQNEGKVMGMKAEVEREGVRVGEREEVFDERNLGDGMMWFRSYSNEGA